jgi:hypothetical protein
VRALARIGGPTDPLARNARDEEQSRKKGRDIEQVGADGAPARQQQPRQRRAGDHAHRSAHGRQRRDRRKLLGPRELLSQSLERRAMEAGRALQDEHQGVDGPCAGRGCECVRQQACQAQRHQRFRPEQQPLAVHAIGHCAANETADDDRHELHNAEQADLGIGARQFVDLPRYGHIADHGAQAGDELAGEQAPESDVVTQRADIKEHELAGTRVAWLRAFCVVPTRTSVPLSTIQCQMHVMDDLPPAWDVGAHEPREFVRRRQESLSAGRFDVLAQGL